MRDIENRLTKIEDDFAKINASLDRIEGNLSRVEAIINAITAVVLRPTPPNRFKSLGTDEQPVEAVANSDQAS